MKLLTSLFLLFGLSFLANAVQIEFHQFESPAQERLYLDLIAELRCVKCQNQNLAESDAELARDMRDKTYDMITAGKSRDDVVSYMTARYGDFVLYRPPFKMNTLLLWLGPPLLMLLSVFVVRNTLRKKATDAPIDLSTADRESIKAMLETSLLESSDADNRESEK